MEKKVVALCYATVTEPLSFREFAEIVVDLAFPRGCLPLLAHRKIPIGNPRRVIQVFRFCALTNESHRVIVLRQSFVSGSLSLETLNFKIKSTEDCL